MPQFNFTTYSSQIFWLLICFSVLYLVIRNVVIPRLHHTINNRTSVIDRDVDEAQKFYNEIEDLNQQIHSIKSQAQTEAQAMIEQSYKNKSMEREQKMEELKQEVENLTKQSKSRRKEFAAHVVFENEAITSTLIPKISKKILT